MTDNDTSTGIAVVCDRSGADAATMAAYLQVQGLAGAAWLSPQDADEAVCEGRAGRVVFPDLTALLEAIWDKEISFDRWLSAGTVVSFVEPLPTTATPTVVYESWRQWERRHRRRQVTAGAILSAVAVVAAFLLMLSVP